MSNELDCKWHFAPRNCDGDNGPNSAMSQNFVHFPCAALVRESIQNSLDAVLDTEKPVIVCFEHRSLDKYDYKNFFELTKHIEAGCTYYSGNPTAKAVYPPMLSYLGSTQEVGFIRVSDYNTKGMEYESGKTDKAFYAFVRSEGVSVKQAEGAGGSFGFGKGAFFVMSPINTLMVSTRNNTGQCFFEGVTRLCSHVIDGQMYSHMGFYDNNSGQPTNDEERIPLPFRRKESGTSIGIMGVEQSEWLKSVDSLVKEVLSNFFVAILRKKLIVYVDGNMSSAKNAILIDNNTIKDLIYQHFPTTRDVRRNNSFNPRPYFEALTDSDIKPIIRKLPILGNVEFHIKEFGENVTQIIYMRKLLMKVYRDYRSLGNLNGVFICENETGNKILGDMEEPEHKMWDPEECHKPEKTTKYADALAAKDELDKFINECLDELCNINANDSVQVSGLEKYLPSMSEEPGKGDKGNPFTGKPTGNYVKEGASLTTEGKIKTDVPVGRKQKGLAVEQTKGNFNQDENGTETGGTGRGRNNGNGGSNKPGDKYDKGNSEDGPGAFNRLVEVDWRPVLSKKKGFIDIIIYPPYDFEAELHFHIGRETQSRKKDDVFIESSSKGEHEGLTIKGVKLNGNARNIIQVAFSDKLSHTLILSVYETN